MAVVRIVTTTANCDICGKYITHWEHEGKGESIDWAKYFIRLVGCTTGEKIVCKECRISKKIETCGLIKKYGAVEKESITGKCMGFAAADGDEPIERCKSCIANSTYDWEEYRRQRQL